MTSSHQNNKRKALPCDSLSEGFGPSNKKSKEYSYNNQTKLLDLYSRKVIESDGNCLFRAILYALLRDDSNHAEFRQSICDYMIKNKEDFDCFINSDDGTFDDYIAKKRLVDLEWGDAPELVAASQILKFNFKVFASKSLNVKYQHHYAPVFPTIVLEHYNGNHHNVLEPKRKDKVSIELSKATKPTPDSLKSYSKMTI